jgi:iron complex transport system substrate-binding protein
MARKTSDRMRIVSLAPSVTSILLELGAGRELVGVSRWCKDVADVGARPTVGDCWKLNIREVMKLRPTLLIGSVPFAAEAVAKILEQPVAFLAINPRTLMDIESDVLTLGRLVDRGRTAERLIRGMRGAFDDVARRARRFGRRSRPRVYCEAWPNPRISSPPWVAELVNICGGEMVVPAGEKISEVQVAEAEPEVIILAWAATGAKADPKQTYKVTAWKDVPAIRNRRVYVICDELLNTPGPPLIEGARALHNVISQENRGQARA